MKMIDYRMLVAEYMEDMIMNNTDKCEWEDNGPRIFNLFLQYFPPTLVLKIKGQPGYDACKDAHDPVTLLVMLRDICTCTTPQRTRQWQFSNKTWNSIWVTRAKPI